MHSSDVATVQCLFYVRDSLMSFDQTRTRQRKKQARAIAKKKVFASEHLCKRLARMNVIERAGP